MRLLRTLGTVLVLIILCASLVLTLVAGPLRFMALNPAFLKTFVPTKSYCEEMRARVSEDLDHVAILYGLESGALNDVVSDESIKTYTSALIDAMFAQETTDSLNLPAYPTDGFAAYLKAHSSYSDKAIEDFSQDCAAAVTEDLSAIDSSLLVGAFTTFRDGPFANASILLFAGGAALTLLMCALLKLMYMGKSKRTGSVVLWGGCFMGVTLVFVPVMQFLLFNYVGRLNVSISAFRTILTGLLNTVLYGWFLVLLVLLLFTILMLTLAIVRACRKKRPRKAEKKA